MQIFILIISIFIFLYRLYKLAKDDHVFIRKNIKMEEIFDSAFIVIGSGLIFAQVSGARNNSYITFFIFGASISLLAICKYKKLPLERFFDFFTLSLLTSLPALYLMESFLFKKIEFILYIICAFTYLFLAIIFNKILLKRTMSRTLKEGNMGIYFVLSYSVLSLVVVIVRTVMEHGVFLNFENIILLFTFFTSLILLFT